MGKIYRWINIPALKKMDKIITVGNHTIDEAEKIGINRAICTFIPNGVNLKKIYEPHTHQDLEKLLANEINCSPDYFQNKKIILRVGRFVPHKGLHWFIDQVMPQLANDYILVGAGGYNPKAVGDGENLTLCQKHIAQHNLNKRVILFPNISQSKMNILFNSADLYISPNIEITGSMEGFGLNIIEAVACGRVVISADLQGLKDAVVDGVSGFLIEPENITAWKNKIEEVFSPNFPREEFTKNAKKYVLNHFTWDNIGRQYLEVLKNL
jgi:phosphatidylinositol alpha-1,6-mannosyltransferase